MNNKKLEKELKEKGYQVFEVITISSSVNEIFERYSKKALEDAARLAVGVPLTAYIDGPRNRACL